MKIKTYFSDDYMYEKVEVIDENDEVIAEISTDGDSPEDNTCGRMSIVSSLESIIKSANPTVKIEFAEGDMDELK